MLKRPIISLLCSSESVNPTWIPVIAFVLSALVSFSTGSSWGTMAILYPLILPAAWSVSQQNGLPANDALMIIWHTTAVILSGSVLGDHCSPISDTTILSSLASRCHHIDHVKTQLPYALTVGGVSVFLSGVMFNLGAAWYINFPLGLAILYGIVRFFGKKTPDYQLENDER